jgi:hypothetical protein
MSALEGIEHGNGQLGIWRQNRLPGRDGRKQAG